MSDMQELIARLEAATEGSRELDGAIWPVADPTEFARQCSFKGKKYAGHVHTKVEKVAHEIRMSKHLAPRYTTSLDAALTLVASNYTPHLCIPPHTSSDVRLFRHADDSMLVCEATDLDITATGHTGPLALCIAALRARSANP